MNGIARVLGFGLLLFLFLTGLVAWSSADEITFQTSADCYALGDTVDFTLYNGSDSTLTFYFLPQWSVWDASADTLVFPQYVLWVVTTFAPDSTQTWSWDQSNYMGNPVSAGTYWVELTFDLGSAGPVTMADTFMVGGVSPVESASWGAIKSLYR